MRGVLPAAALAAALATLAACDTPPDRNTAYNYRPGYEEQTLPLRYARDAVDPVPEDGANLADIRVLLRPQSVLTLQVREAGPLATARAERVAGALNRTVEGQVSREPGWGQAILLIRTPTIVADACLQPPTRVGRNLWTFDDYSRERLLPPGCANAVMLLRQAEAGQDTLQGRPLPPGAALPMARAADRYLRRNDVRDQQRRPARDDGGTTDDPGDSPGSGSGSGSGQGPAAPAAAAPGTAVPGTGAPATAVPGVLGPAAASQGIGTPANPAGVGGIGIAPSVLGGTQAPR